MRLKAALGALHPPLKGRRAISSSSFFVTSSSYGSSWGKKQHKQQQGMGSRLLHSRPLPLASSDAIIRRRVLSWLRHVVIGLNLCPFASATLQSGALKIKVLHGKDLEGLLHEALTESRRLGSLPPHESQTSLLVIPGSLLEDFYDYNDFCITVDKALEESGLASSVQLATFHPHYCFRDQQPHDPENWTNRSPFPLLHLLREVEVEKAIRDYGDTSRIYKRNMALMRKLGPERIRQLMRRGEEDEDDDGAA